MIMASIFGASLILVMHSSTKIQNRLLGHTSTLCVHQSLVIAVLKAAMKISNKSFSLEVTK